MTECVIFKAQNSTYGSELYIMSADGQSVSLLGDINPGAGNGITNVYASSLVATWPGDRIVFSADDGQNGGWLWITDGSAEGTYSLGGLVPDSALQGIAGRFLTSTSGYTYVTSYSGDDWENSAVSLWRTDGTVTGTQEIAAVSDRVMWSMDPVAQFGDTVLWVSSGETQSDGTEARLWAYDETTGALTVLGSAFSFDLSHFTLLGDERVVFTRTDPVEGGQLWITDGTVAGTQMLLDPNPGIRNHAILEVKAHNDLIVFTVRNGGRGFAADLWVSDGTVAGTHKLIDLDPTALDEVDRLVISGDTLFVRATDGTAQRLFVSDGTAAGTTALHARDGTLLDMADMDTLQPLGDTGRVIFTFDPMPQYPGMEELWVSDGTAAGTFKLLDLDMEDRYRRFWAVGDQVYFKVADPEGGLQLWATDGTVTGTRHLPGVDAELLERYYFYIMGTIDVNEAPEALALSGTQVGENAAAGTVVGTLSAMDPENNGALSYQLLDAAGGRFAIRGNQLVVAGPLDYEAAPQHQVTLRVTDIRGGTQDRTFTLTLRDGNDAPTALALTGTEVTENVARGTVVGTLSASDQDGDALSYRLIDSAGGRFALRGSQIVTAGPINYEHADRQIITVQVSDGQGGVTQRDITIHIGNVNDPTIGADHLRGGAGADTIRALAGDDVVAGAGGGDLLQGGTGHGRL